MIQQHELEYRFMTMQDVAAVAELERLSFSTPWPHEAFVGELTRNPNARYVVVLHQNRIVAYCGMWIIVDEAHITNVAVHPLYRGKKIGLSLMIKMMNVARMYHAKSMTLEVRPSNTVARSMYTKLGFREHGVRKRYYSDNDEDAIIMWVNL